MVGEGPTGGNIGCGHLCFLICVKAGLAPATWRFALLGSAIRG
jgi:hypothetical protein